MSKFAERLRIVPPRSVVIVQTSLEEDQMRLMAELLRYYKDGNSIIISSIRPIMDFVEKLGRYDFDMRKALEDAKLYVIDLVSKSVGVEIVKNVLFVHSPTDLSAAQMAFEKVIEVADSQSGRTLVLLDSVSTLLIYNSPDAVLQFLHFLVGRIRVLQFNGVIFAVEGAVEERMLSATRQFCDMMIKV